MFWKLLIQGLSFWLKHVPIKTKRTKWNEQSHSCMTGNSLTAAVKWTSTFLFCCLFTQFNLKHNRKKNDYFLLNLIPSSPWKHAVPVVWNENCIQRNQLLTDFTATPPLHPSYPIKVLPLPNWHPIGSCFWPIPPSLSCPHFFHQPRLLKDNYAQWLGKRDDWFCILKRKSKMCQML